MRPTQIIKKPALIVVLLCVTVVWGCLASDCGFTDISDGLTASESSTTSGFPATNAYIAFGHGHEWYGYHPYLVKYYCPSDSADPTDFANLANAPYTGTFDLYTGPNGGGSLLSENVDWTIFKQDSDTFVIQLEFNNFNDLWFTNSETTFAGQVYGVTYDNFFNFAKKWNTPDGVFNEGSRILSLGIPANYYVIADQITVYWCDSGTGPDPTPTPTPTPFPGNIAVNLLEKYSNAALVNQAITLTPTAGGAGETKTSLYGETLHFGVVPGMEYWFNASRPGYSNYNETYTIPASPGIYNVYMERILTPIANHSYAHFSVVDQTNGGLIPNAEIRLSDGQTKLTNSAGYAWFSVNNSEQINYYVSKPSGYWPAYGAMNLTADESILVALQRYTGPTATATMPGWTPVTVPTTGTGSGPVVTLSAQLREQNVQEGMDVWYTNLPFISQFLFLLFIIGGLGLMAGGTRRN